MTQSHASNYESVAVLPSWAEPELSSYVAEALQVLSTGMVLL